MNKTGTRSKSSSAWMFHSKNFPTMQYANKAVASFQTVMNSVLGPMNAANNTAIMYRPVISLWRSYVFEECARMIGPTRLGHWRTLARTGTRFGNDDVEVSLQLPSSTFAVISSELQLGHTYECLCRASAILLSTYSRTPALSASRFSKTFEAKAFLLL